MRIAFPTSGTASNGHRADESRRLADRATDLVTQVDLLDALGRRIGDAFARVVRPGPVKDALSGTKLGHPAHPLLTDVPIGAWTSALVLDVFGGERASPAADRLVGFGVLAALPTALTGVNDLTDVVESEDRRLGTAHALGNALAVTLYAASWLARRAGARSAGVRLSLGGAAVLTASGFLGGHLAYRRGLGVDNTVFERPPKEWTSIVAVEELPDGKPRRVSVNGLDVFVLRTGERIVAVANRCSHRGGPLHKGRLHDGGVECPWHRSMFRLADGEVVRGPATAPQPSYETRVRDGRVEVRAR